MPKKEFPIETCFKDLYEEFCPAYHIKNNDIAMKGQFQVTLLSNLIDYELKLNFLDLICVPTVSLYQK